MRPFLAAALGLALTAASASEALAITQPGSNVPIPTTGVLQALFDSRGESIDALADALTTPETFTPQCNLEFEVLLRNAGYRNTFGWYNVQGVKPQPTELVPFLDCNDDPGTIKSLNIAGHPDYVIGLDVGFYEAAGPQGCPPGPVPLNNQNLFFSQKGYNPDGNEQDPYIHLLIYNSTVTPNAFYFAWEDLLAGGDDDFDDLVTFVSGITCTGGGGACQTGQPGVCADGTMQCQNGELTCLGLSAASDEQCDGLDNDCDGVADELDGGPICPGDEVCDKGTCVEPCTSAEFPCPPQKVCNDLGLCVDPGCKDIDCPAGTACKEGECVAPCDGVVCPQGQVCLVGACVDPCSKITCSEGQICEAGACIDPCECTGCGATQSCAVSGACEPTACDAVTCDPGFYCNDEGACADACEGAVCPKGEICETGQCVPDEGAGAGGQGGGTSNPITVGVGGEDTGGGGTRAAGGAPPGAAPGLVVEPLGCGDCRATGRRGSGAGWLVWLGALAALRRRSGRRGRSRVMGLLRATSGASSRSPAAPPPAPRRR